MNLDGFKEFEEPTRLVLSGIFDGDVLPRSLLPAFPETWLCFFAFHALRPKGDAANFCCLAGFVDSFADRFAANCGVLSGFVGVPWIGESLAAVLVACRREATPPPPLFKRFLESVKRLRESARRPNLGEDSPSVDLLRDVERWRVGCGIRLLLGLLCCETETETFRKIDENVSRPTSTCI